MRMLLDQIALHSVHLEYPHKESIYNLLGYEEKKTWSKHDNEFYCSFIGK